MILALFWIVVFVSPALISKRLPTIVPPKKFVIVVADELAVTKILPKVTEGVVLLTVSVGTMTASGFPDFTARMSSTSK